MDRGNRHNVRVWPYEPLMSEVKWGHVSAWNVWAKSPRLQVRVLHKEDERRVKKIIIAKKLTNMLHIFNLLSSPESNLLQVTKPVLIITMSIHFQLRLTLGICGKEFKFLLIYDTATRAETMTNNTWTELLVTGITHR